jgi:putative endonuclease
MQMYGKKGYRYTGISLFSLLLQHKKIKKMEITTSHRSIGFQGEEEAVRHLVENHYRILARNWQFHHLEVDIIAENDDFIVFCEVKTRKNNRYGEPETFVDMHKQRHLFAAADYYTRHYGIRKEVRFDILSVIRNEEGMHVTHIPDAFAPQW